MILRMCITFFVCVYVSV